MAPGQRGYLGAALDRFVAWQWGLPPESDSYTVESLQIPMEDDVKLAADLYRPVSAKPVGTILVRSPYGIGILFAVTQARIFAARGYQVLLNSCRGTAASGGEFDPARHEEADGHAVVAWMRKQDWYTGSFATLGPSYLGFVQWALLSNPPPDMKAAIISTGPFDFSKFAWGTGAFRSDTIRWADFQAHLKSNSLIPMPLYALVQPGKVDPVIESIPLLEGAAGYFDGNTKTWISRMISTPDLRDPYWKPLQHDDALEKVQIPVHLATGWYDLLMPDVMDEYKRLAERGCTVALTVGPWSHSGTGGSNTSMETLAWLDTYLGGRRDDPGRKAPVRLFFTGKEEWRDLPKWPPPTAPYELYLGNTKRLSRNPPPPDAPDSSFKFDPANPTPDAGAPTLFGGSKSNDNTVLCSRPDVLTFTTEPLDQDLEVAGKPSVQLHHSSNNPHVDVLVVLSEVDAKGKSYQITERYLRLPVSRDPGPLELVLHDCAHVFRAGTRLRLLVAGSSHPRFLRNLGTGEDPWNSSSLKPAVHTIQHNASAISKLILPVAGPA